MMFEALSKVLWRLYLFILVASIFLLALGSTFLWGSIVNEAKTELIYANKIVSRSLLSLLNKNEALFKISSAHLLELDLFNNNPDSIKLLDDILENNQELAGISIANPQGDVILTSSNYKIENLPNFLQKEETKESFEKALNSDSLVMGRTFFLKEFNDWIVPIRYRILNKNNEVIAVFATGIKIKGDNSPWQLTNIEDSLRVSVIDSNYYFQFVSFIEDKDLKSIYDNPVTQEYLDFFSEKLFQQIGLTLKEFIASDNGIAFIEYSNPAGEPLIAAFSYDLKYGHFIFTTLLKSELKSKFLIPMALFSSLLLVFMIVLFWLFRHLSRLQIKSKTDLEQQSQHDQLTGLPNLRYLSLKFNQWKKSHSQSYSAVFIDLDNFKSSNDIHGHSVGDEILKIVAKRINKYFNNALCIRQGGDEFIVITENNNNINCIDVCRAFLIELKKPITTNDLVFSIRASIGIAQSPQDGIDLETLLRKADIAMYEAKRKKCGVNVYTPQLDKRNTRIAMIGKELNNAIATNEFSLVYQPQIELSNNKVIGVEVLLRWNNEILHRVPPSEFIPIAESTGVILDIGKYVLEKSFKEFHDVCNEILKNDDYFNDDNQFRLSINVSIMQLSNPNFLKHLLDLFQRFDCKKAKLVLEITETLIIANIDKIGEILREIRQSGIEISLDDFGTGYSSLAYLINLPINELKIDKSFVKGMTNNQNNIALIKSILNLGTSLGLGVIAEGVESHEQITLLQKHHCKYGQGYYFSKPINKIELLSYLKKQSVNSSIMQ